jgi:hypothetical protein
MGSDARIVWEIHGLGVDEWVRAAPGPGRAEKIAPPPQNDFHATGRILPAHVYGKAEQALGFLLFSAAP